MKAPIVERLYIIRNHLRTGRLGQREAWEEWLTEAAEEIASPRFEVVQLQPDDDCPGLWIGFKTGKDRDEAMKLFALEEPKP